MEGGALRRRIARMTLRAWEFRARVRDRGLVELAPPVRRCRRGGRSSATPRFRFGLRSSERGLETRARGTRPSSAAFCRRGGRSSATPGSASGRGVRSADSRRGLVELAPPARPFVVVEGGALRRPVPLRAAEFGARTRDAGSWNSPLQCAVVVVEGGALRRPGSASGCGVRSADSRRGLVELAPPVRPFVVVEGGALLVFDRSAITG